MKVLHTRQDLIDLVAASPPTNAIGTALTRGTVEVLGAFKNLSSWMGLPGNTGDRPGYILKITSERKKTWRIAVVVDELARKYFIFQMEAQDVPWHHWTGSWSQRRCLIDGDFPASYGLLRTMARKK